MVFGSVMGQLEDGLHDWAKAIIRKPATQAEKLQQRTQLQEAQDKMLAGLVSPEGDWDEADRRAWDILQNLDSNK